MLKIKDLKVYFKTDDGIAKAVDGVDIRLRKGEVHSLVGESGCGKSVTALSILGLIDSYAGFVAGGKILYEQPGQNDPIDILRLKENKLLDIRGKKISMIFQEPMTSLNPVFRIGYQIGEAYKTHFKNISKRALKDKVIEMLKQVGITEPDKRYNSYPFELSGGMLQRAMIAMALICEPDIIIADEPTTALDVTIQAQILDLLLKLKDEHNTSLLFITHDLGVVSQISDFVSVMYAGKIIEKGRTADLFKYTSHPYTKGLLESLPSLKESSEELNTIKGVVPSAVNYPDGCRFNNRCPNVIEKCKNCEPELIKKNNLEIACFNPVN